MFERKTRGSRMMLIIIELYRTGSNHVEALEEKFSVSRKTIYRDLEQLEPMLVKSSRGTYCLSRFVYDVLHESIG